MSAPSRAASTHPAFAPGVIGPLTLKNRTIKTATYEGMTPGGIPSEALVEHHRRLAAGGVGMTTVAYCAVSPDGRTFGEQMVMTEANVARLQTLTGAVHAEGAKVALQLGHAGFFTKNADRTKRTSSTSPAWRGSSDFRCNRATVRGFTESLAAELAGSTVGATAVLPGAIRTQVLRASRHDGDGTVEGLADLLERHARPPSVVARRIVRAIRRNDARAIIGAEAHLTDWLGRISPVAAAALLGWGFAKARERRR